MQLRQGGFPLESRFKKLGVQNTPSCIFLLHSKLDLNVKFSFSNYEKYIHEFVPPRFGTKTVPCKRYFNFSYFRTGIYCKLLRSRNSYIRSTNVVISIQGWSIVEKNYPVLFVSTKVNMSNKGQGKGWKRLSHSKHCTNALVYEFLLVQSHLQSY